MSSLFVACAPSFRVLFTRIWFLFARSSRKRCLPGTVLPMGGTDTHWPISSSLPAMSAAKSVDCDRSWHNASFCLSLRDDWRYMAGDLSCARLRSSRVTKSLVTKSQVVRRKVNRFVSLFRSASAWSAFPGTSPYRAISPAFIPALFASALVGWSRGSLRRPRDIISGSAREVASHGVVGCCDSG